MTPDTIRDRVTSVCGGLGLTQAQTPFSFDLQPSGQIDQVFRAELQAVAVIGGFNYTEERTDLVTVWVARKHHGQPNEAYRTLLTDISSLRSGIVRDGLVTSGEYLCPDDGWGWEIQRESGNGYAVLRLFQPLNYEATV